MSVVSYVWSPEQRALLSQFGLLRVVLIAQPMLMVL
jgi:hypothetical protein